ncbi:MAG: hypothetical protein HY579_02025, partial [Nitrospinae bacterium]|nr:hypothetical protein [Nitrospinota bacterium]
MEISPARQNALLSQAAYADLNNGPILSSNALTSVGMTEQAATELAKTYKVLDQYNATNGFSATVFENKITGEKTLAIRGTELDPLDPFDILTDLVDVALGTTLSPQYNTLQSYYQALVNAHILDGSFNVTGHSLGGFLAQSFTLDHPDVVNHTYTYNSPGLGGIDSPLTNILQAAGASNTNIPNDKITNYYAENGPEIISGLGTIMGESIGITVDSGLGLNHGIKTLTDAFAVYNFLGKIDPTLTIESATNILNTNAGLFDKIQEFNAFDPYNDTYMDIDAKRTLGDIFRDVIDFFHVAQNPPPPPRRDPLVLDLDGDGLELSALDGSNVNFDFDANGFAERTAWASADDGFLALDRNGDGAIGNGSELFGNAAPVNNG